MTSFAEQTPANQGRFHPSWCGARLCTGGATDVLHLEEPIQVHPEGASGTSASISLCRGDEIIDDQQVVHPSEFRLEVRGERTENDGSVTFLSMAEVVRLMLMGLSRGLVEDLMTAEDLSLIRALLDASEEDGPGGPTA